MARRAASAQACDPPGRGAGRWQWPRPASLAAGCGSVAAHPPPRPAGAGHSPAPADGPSASAPKGHAAPALEAMLPRHLDGIALDRASTTGKAIFAEFGGTAWAQQMTRYLASVGKTPADLYYAQVWDPSGASGP